MRLFDKIMSIFEKTLWIVFVIFFCFIISISLFIKAMYDFQDYPYFTCMNVFDVLTISICGLIFILLSKYKNLIETKINYPIIITLFIIAAILYLYLVPLKPFSDMAHVWQGAKDFAEFNWDNILQSEYMQTFKGNIKLSVIFGFFLFFLPNTIFSIKAVNVLLLLGIGILNGAIAKNLNWKYPKLICLLTLFFLPLFLYLNHVYFDLLFLFISILSIYIYTKKKSNIWISFAVLGVAYIFRVNSLIYICVILVDYIMKIKKRLFKKSIKELLIAFILFFTIGVGGSKIISVVFYDKTISSYPIWNQFYIGINDEKFGFMDGDFDVNRSATDVWNRMKEYGTKKTLGIYIKKNLWLWSEGTLQASRYAFGTDAGDYKEKYEYETILTPYLMSSNQVGRKFLTSLCRSQFIVFLVGMLYIVIKKGPRLKNVRIVYMLFLGTIVILTFYEMKSRYIIHCVPFIICMAIQSDSVTKMQVNKSKRF